MGQYGTFVLAAFDTLLLQKGLWIDSLVFCSTVQTTLSYKSKYYCFQRWFMIFPLHYFKFRPSCGVAILFIFTDPATIIGSRNLLSFWMIFLQRVKESKSQIWCFTLQPNDIKFKRHHVPAIYYHNQACKRLDTTREFVWVWFFTDLCHEIGEVFMQGLRKTWSYPKLGHILFTTQLCTVLASGG